MKNRLLLIAFTAYSLLLVGCFGGAKSRSKEALKQGTVEGITYTNPYFKFSLNIDTAWFEHESAPIKYKRPFEADLIRISKYPQDSNYIDDAYLYFYAEKTNPFSSDPKKNLKDLKEGMEFILSNEDYISEIRDTTIDGVPFYKLDVKLTDADNDLITYQEFYSTVIKDYHLVLSKTYCYPSQRQELDAMFKTINFYK